MKKIVVLVIAFVMCFSMVVVADPVEIDLSSMSMEELVALRNEINDELSSRMGGEGYIGCGSYVVGRDIKEGTFNILNTSDTWGNYYIYDNADDDIYSSSGSFDENCTCTVVLKEGMKLELNHFGGGVITESTPFWAP